MNDAVPFDDKSNGTAKKGKGRGRTGEEEVS